MTEHSGPQGDILAGGHRNWLPLALDGSQPDLAGDLRERFAGHTAGFDLEAGIAAITTLVDQLAQPPDAALPALNLAAWVHLEDPDTLLPGAFALLRGVQVAESTTLEECRMAVVGTEPTYSEPVVEALATRSGPATSVRVRPMVETEAGQAVHQRSAVFWLRAEQQLLYVLSTYSADLVQAATDFERLEELAAGMEGL